MKILPLVLLFAFTSISANAQSLFPESFIGEWTGEGSLLGNEANYEMKWEQVLNERFVRLTFKNSFKNNTFEMTAHGYYKSDEKGGFTGQWFDTRGIDFPLKGSLSSDSIISFWGTEAIEQGKTEYHLISENEIHAVDYVLKDGTYQKFGEAIYTRKP